jgi:hypothetical protein
VSRAPDGAQFCCVTAIERYARDNRLSPEQPAISVGDKGLNWDYVRTITRLTAIEHGLDPSRLVPHSLRHGAPTQMASNGSTVADIRQQGGWAARNVHAPDYRGNPAAAIHDINAVPIEVMAHALGSITTPPPFRPVSNGMSVGAGGSTSHQALGTHQPR